jgi:hypothetical protein
MAERHPLFPDTSAIKPSIQDRFEAFHTANPHIFELFKQYAHDALGSGSSATRLMPFFIGFVGT